LFEVVALVGAEIEVFVGCVPADVEVGRNEERSVEENGFGREEEEDADALMADADAFLDEDGPAVAGLAARDAAAAAALARAASERFMAFMFASNLGAEAVEAAAAVEQSCSLGKRCCGQNCCLQLSHLIGE
jgi:hypothetical protein